MIHVTVNADGLNQLLRDLEKKSGNLRPALVGVAGIMMGSTAENFEKEGRPKWQDLAQSTKDKRAKKGKWPGQMLRVTSGLANSISRRVTGDSAIVGTNKAYAAIHQFGGRAGKAEIPARPFLKLEPEDILKAEELLMRHLMKFRG